MAVTFVIGRAGSGKTRRCFDRVVAELRKNPLTGPPILWIVPRQATFTTERELTCNSGLGAFSRARILSFERLVQETHNACGGSNTPEVTPLGRQMILGHLLRRNQTRLKFFSSVARQPGVAVELDAAFDEMERSGVSQEDLGAILHEKHPFIGTEADPDALLAKLHDIHLLFEAYNDFLGQDRLDQARRLKFVQDCIQKDKLFQGASVFVDGFLDYTDHERRILGALAQSAHSVEITVLADLNDDIFANPDHHPSELQLFRRTEEAFRRLWFTFKEDQTPIAPLVKLKSDTRRPATLRHVEQCLFDSRAKSSSDGEAVEFLVAPDRTTEVDAAARRISDLTEAGYRLRDIWVLVRNLDQYEALIAPAFREHRIPFFIDRRLTASHHPLLMLTRAAIAIARFDWPHESVMTLIKSGLAPVAPHEAADLENYVLRHRLMGGAAWEAKAPWSYHREITRCEDSDDASAGDPSAEMQSLRVRLWNALKPIIEKARSDKPVVLKEIAAALFETLKKFEVPQTLHRWITDAERAGDLQQRDEHHQVWAQFTGLFDEMVDLFGDEPMTFEDFVDILESGLERFDLGVTPPTVDQVLVGQVDRTRTGRPRAAIVMGLNERDFPRVPDDGCILTDAERKVLRQRKFDLDPDCRGKLLDERLFAYIAFTRASEKLIVSCCLSTDGKGSAEPSTFWRELVRLTPTAAHTLVPVSSLADLSQVSTPRQALTGLMKWIRSQTDDSHEIEDEQSNAWRSVYQWMATQPDSGGSVAELRRRCWSAVNYQNSAKLSPLIASRLFQSPLDVTARQLETFAACPFQHFVRHGLHLEGRESAVVTGLDLSEICHRALDRLVSDVIVKKLDWTGDPPPIPAADIERCAREIAHTLRGEVMLGNARSRYLLQRVHQAINDIVQAQIEIMKRSDFRPARSTVRIGDAKRGVAALAVQTPAGAAVNIRGKVDRVDVSADGKHLVVLDYRLSAQPLALGETFHGLSLQLLSGLIALLDSQKDGATEKGPGGALTLQLFWRFRNVSNPKKADDPLDPASKIFAKSRGVFDASLLPSFDRSLVNGRSRIVNAFLKKDGTMGRGSSDAAMQNEFAAIIAHVRRRLGELADAILAGDISIGPYRLSNVSPCVHCGLQSICRFERGTNSYRFLPSLKRDEAIEAMLNGAAPEEPDAG